MRLIDADDLVEWIDIGHLRNPLESVYSERDVVDMLESRPTIDPDSLRPKGLWIGEGDGYADGELVYDVWYCSECNHCIDDGTDDPEMLPNYCPNCGAKMEG